MREESEEVWRMRRREALWLLGFFGAALLFVIVTAILGATGVIDFHPAGRCQD